uniref:Uncharacterized protein n=1 Tax=Sphaerodactylus townsendi TaxID=933632 RepID=A0ACB8FET2_9SAUR
MRQHYKSCKKYQDEYGVPSSIPNLEISQDSTGNSFRSESSISEIGENSNLQVSEEDTRCAIPLICTHTAVHGQIILDLPQQEGEFLIGNTSDLCNQPAKQKSGQPTFKCPLCQESNFTRQCLLDHCNNSHLYQIDAVICPICVSLPWGDPTQVTRDFANHLNQRHQVDYGGFMPPYLHYLASRDQARPPVIAPPPLRSLFAHNTPLLASISFLGLARSRASWGGLGRFSWEQMSLAPLLLRRQAPWPWNLQLDEETRFQNTVEESSQVNL